MYVIFEATWLTFNLINLPLAMPKPRTDYLPCILPL